LQLQQKQVKLFLGRNLYPFFSLKAWLIQFCNTMAQNQEAISVCYCLCSFFPCWDCPVSPHYQLSVYPAC